MDIPERAEAYQSAHRGIALTALTDIPQQPLGLGLGLAVATWAKAWAMMLFPFKGLDGLSIVGTKTLVRVAPVGLCPYWSSLPKVWSPLQGYAPWALMGVAPLGLARLLLAFGASGSRIPRVWSPLQGYAPWALMGVAPLGLARLLLAFGVSGWEGSGLVGEKFVLSALRSLYIRLGARPVYVWGACPIVLTRSLH